MVTYPSGKPHLKQDQTESASFCEEARLVQLIFRVGRMRHVVTRVPDKWQPLPTRAEQNPAYSRTQPLGFMLMLTNTYADPFRDRTRNLSSEHNPYLHLLRHNHHLPLLHGKQLQRAAACWHTYFQTAGMAEAQALLVEIGCYRGNNLLQVAQRYPQTACIGIDLTFKRVVLSAQAIHAQQLPNAVSVLSDARDLAALFQPDTLDGVICFFPDPWAKPRQRKKRLLSMSYCAQLAQLLKDGGFVWLKTDDDDYFADASKALQAQGFCFSDEVPVKLISVFEQRFLAAHKKYHQGVLINDKHMPITRHTHDLVRDGEAEGIAPR